MSQLSLAYIFHNQQLLVDENYQLPKVATLASDLKFKAGDEVIARDLLEHEPIPAGLQLILPNMPWFALPVAITNIHVYSLVSLRLLPKVRMKFYWLKMHIIKVICMD